VRCHRWEKGGGERNSPEQTQQSSVENASVGVRHGLPGQIHTGGPRQHKSHGTVTALAYAEPGKTQYRTKAGEKMTVVNVKKGGGWRVPANRKEEALERAIKPFHCNIDCTSRGRTPESQLKTHENGTQEIPANDTSEPTGRREKHRASTP